MFKLLYSPYVFFVFLFACSSNEQEKKPSIEYTGVIQINSFAPEHIAVIPRLKLPANEYRQHSLREFIVDGYVDSMNLKQGHWVIEDKTNNLRYQGVYVDGLPEGWWVVFSRGDLICAGNYAQNMKQGYWGYLPVDQYTTSKYVNYVNDTLEGLAREFGVDSTLLSDGYYKNGLKDGYWKFYYPDGTMKAQGRYHKNYKSGWWISYDEQGEISEEANYSKGEISGYFKRYINGVLSEEGEKFDKKRKGVWKFYDAKGQQKYINEYDD